MAAALGLSSNTFNPDKDIPDLSGKVIFNDQLKSYTMKADIQQRPMWSRADQPVSVMASSHTSSNTIPRRSTFCLTKKNMWTTQWNR